MARHDTGRRVRTLLALFLGLAAAGCTTGATVSVYEENDASYLGGDSDRDYTQGLRMSWLYPTERAPQLAQDAAKLTKLSIETTEAIALLIGHELYTPADIREPNLDEQDRPYAAWLYVGIGVANVERPADEPTSDRLDSFEFDVGVVGPMAQGKYVQTRVHEAIGSPRPRGWEHQLENEVGAVAMYEHRRRLIRAQGPGDTDLDVVGGIGLSLGNIYQHAQASAIARLGWRIPRDFGINTIHRSSAEVGGEVRGDEEREQLTAYVFGGAEGRAVARNIFLDGNMFRDSHSVNTLPLVGEAMGGIALAYGNWRLALTQVVRTAEFEERRRPQRFGSLSLVYQLGF